MSSRVLSLAVVAIVAGAITLTAVMGGDDAATMTSASRMATATPTVERPITAITAEGIGADLDALQAIANRNAGTRADGTRGFSQTVDYVARRLRQNGWAVRTQELTVPIFVQRAAPLLAIAGRRVKRVEALLYSGSGEVRGRVRRAAGLGCSKADFGGVHRGVVAVVRRGTCFLSVKARNAAAAGAGAVVIVNTGKAPFTGTLVQPGLRVPVVAVGSTTGHALRTGTELRVRVRAVSKRAGVRNVIAQTPSAATAGEVVMAGAHLDSVPAGPGINDDGSGVAALLEASKVLLDRPVRLGFWAAEELGLYGSRHYVASLSAAERKQIAAYVNLDMVGTPGGHPEVYGDKAVEQALRAAAGTKLRRSSIGGASDHASFRRAGIPVGGLFTGLHRCYHRACDTAARVDRPLTLRMARVTATAVQELTR